ncbi:MAG: FKBP-type peptidyl-prolyl cis-trans isomerase [Phycisphaerales bacterium JB039]
MKWPLLTLLPLLASGAAFAQNETLQANEAQAEAPAPVEIEPLDAEAQRLVDMLTGSWRTSSPIAEGDDHLVVHLAPFTSPTLGHVIYVESAREGDPWTATRQSLFKVYRFGDQLRLRTLEFRSHENRQWEHLIGMWAAPDLIPGDQISADATIATMDLNMDAAATGCAGASPCPYPTREYDAVEMTSSLQISPDRIVTKDTFYGADGSVVAGAGVTSDASGIEWEPLQTDVTVQRDDDGLVQIFMTSVPEDAETPTEGANVYVHYSGWLLSGQMFDSSHLRGVAYRFVYPGQFIEGWSRAIADMAPGARRKLIIPPELGYADRPMRSIPPNSTLIFDVEMLKIEPPTEPAPTPDQPAGNQGGGNAGGGSGNDGGG